MVVNYVARHLVAVIFFAALSGSLVSMALLFAVEELVAVGASAVSAVFSLWSIWMSERGGFVRTRQMRRAFEPERHFNGAQVLMLMLAIMAQIGLCSYVLLT